MRTRITLAIALSLTFWTATRIHAQITSNPIPGRIEKRGLAVEIRDVVRLARVSYVRELPDGRRFANDSRGFLYLIDQNSRPQVYADVSEAFPYGVRHLLKLLSRRSGQ